MKQRRRAKYLRALTIISIALSPIARAEVTQKDLQVLGRSLGFVKSSGSTGTKLVVVVDPKKPLSVSDADTVLTLISGGLKSGSRTLTPSIVKIDDLAAVGDVAAFLLTSSMKGDAGQIKNIAKDRHIPCATNDVSLVQNGSCAIGVTTEPKVEIMINKSVAADDGITLDDAFKMLITEI